MANPQKEDGHVDIANEIVEALAKTQLSGYESRVLWIVFRKTYGWHKKEDWITNTQISEMTGIIKTHISRTVKGLIQRNIIIRNGKKIAFQKNYDKWKKLPKLVTSEKLPKMVTKVTKNGNRVTKIGIKKLPKSVYTKETKRNYTKEIISSQIKNLLNLFPAIIKERIQIYWDNATQKNKTGIITEGRKLTLLTELYNLMKRTDDNNLFEYALETANRYGVANIGYLGAVIKNKITEVKD